MLAIRERDGGSPAIVYFLSSEEAAIRGREEIVATIGEENDDDIDQRRSLIFAHPDRSDSEAAATFGHCLVEVSENRWAAWTGIGAEQLAWPFSDK